VITLDGCSRRTRWMFKKNSMEFFIGLDYYLYYSYSGCTTISPWSYVLLECSMITWPCHMIWLPKFLCCLYLNPFVWLSAQMHRNLFSFWGSYNNILSSSSLWTLLSFQTSLFFLISNPIHGSCLLFALNSNTLVLVYTLLLYTNSAIANQSGHYSWQWSMNILKYCSNF